MTVPLFIALPGNDDLARRMAELAGGETGILETHSFPDGETRLRFRGELSGRTVILVCTLAQPDLKLPGLLFAAQGARSAGASQLGLIAPYLAYMRQDRAFQPGEIVSAQALAGLLSQNFDWLITVDPHLHRIRALDDIYTVPAVAAHAAPALAAWITANVKNPFLIGPDEESRQWVSAVANRCGASFAVLAKTRFGDRQISIGSEAAVPPGATPVLLDDIISSGATAIEALRMLPNGSEAIVMAIHGVCSQGALDRLRQMGVRVVTTNTVPNPAAKIDITPLIAATMKTLPLPI